MNITKLKTVKPEGSRSEPWSAEAGTPEANETKVLSILIEKHENEYSPARQFAPVEAIKFRMEQLELTQQELVPFLAPVKEPGIF